MSIIKFTNYTNLFKSQFTCQDIILSPEQRLIIFIFLESPNFSKYEMDRIDFRSKNGMKTQVIAESAISM